MTSFHSLFPSSKVLEALTGDHRAWPAGAEISATDISVLGLSLTTVGASITPIVVTGPTADPVRPSSIVIVRILRSATKSRLARHEDEPLDVTIDANLSACLPLLNEARLLGRKTPLGRTPTRLRWPNGERSEPGELPRELHPDELLAIPCLGKITPRQLSAHRIILGAAKTSNGLGSHHPGTENPWMSRP